MKYFLWLPCLLLFQFCINTKNDSGESEEHKLPVIKVKEAFDENRTISIEKLCSSIDYVALETNEQCVIKDNPEIFVDNNYIVVIAFRQILVFDRNTGDFIREIGQRGKGPGEYSATIREGEVFNFLKSTVKAKKNGDKIIEYDLNGNITSIIPTPIYVLPFTETKQGNFIGYVPNDGGSEEVKLVTFDSLGKELYRIANKDFFDTQTPGVFRYLDDEAGFYKNGDHTYFKEAYNDTIYQISDRSMIPSAIVDTHGLSPYFGIKGEKDYSNILSNTLHIKDFFQVKNYLFFTSNYQKSEYSGYHNLSSGETEVSNSNDNNANGFYYDNTDFTFLYPQRSNLDDEIFGYIDAKSIIDYNKSQPEARSKLPQNLKNVKLLDNPIIFIARVK